MRIRFVKDDENYQPGDVVDCDMPGVAELYVARGVAEYVAEGDAPPRENKIVKPAKVKVKA